MSPKNRGRRHVVLGASLAVLVGCTAQQISTVQQDQLIVQAILNAGCSNPEIRLALQAAIPGGGLVCVGGVVAASIVTTVMNDPALIAKVESLHK